MPNETIAQRFRFVSGFEKHFAVCFREVFLNINHLLSSRTMSTLWAQTLFVFEPFIMTPSVHETDKYGMGLLLFGWEQGELPLCHLTEGVSRSATLTL